MKYMDPIIRWPGGKRGLLKYLLRVVPADYGCYFEPFVGSGALFFSLLPPRAFLSDTNEELISLYATVRDEQGRLVRALRQLRNSREDYYRVRAARPKTEAARAARLMYLCNLSFNGIYRVNREGEFNVPYGGRAERAFFDVEALRGASRALASSRIESCDFEDALDVATEGDFVYIDPPYARFQGGERFVRYNEKIFQWRDQVRLAAVVQRLHKKKCRIVLSNGNDVAVRALYPYLRVQEICRHSCVAARPHGRRSVTELVLTNGDDSFRL